MWLVIPLHRHTHIEKAVQSCSTRIMSNMRPTNSGG
jgi:hypothetical protein